MSIINMRFDRIPKKNIKKMTAAAGNLRKPSVFCPFFL